MNPFEAQLTRLSVHHVGNKYKGEDLILSSQEHPILSEELEQLLWKYFIDNMIDDRIFKMSTDPENLATILKDIFKSPENFHQAGIAVAERLYDTSDHPNFIGGEVFLAYFKNMMHEDEVVDAIGIFKSELKEDYIKPISGHNQLSLVGEKGINVSKLDRGCLILNTEAEDGFRILNHERNSASANKYWSEAFLCLEAVSNEYHHTNHYLKLTKDFVTKRLPEYETVSKADQIDYLNRSMNYFKGKDHFDCDEFKSEIFEKSDTQSAFDNYKTNYSAQKNIALNTAFDISQNAVDKNKRVYRSVLKLDKNFHVYIHGDRSLIERGKDSDGRKYYKIYYNEES
ncbi:MAG: nucleoid-associated protein [Bacteroidia bacterium]|nr:nucleoid-associated protein [Bacteroidia bacterium]